MLSRFINILLAIFLVTISSIGVRAQTGADGNHAFYKGEDMTKGARESMVRMRIERDKKDHDEMLQRGEEVRRLSERLEKTFAQNGGFSDEDRRLLESLEKNVKKIRDELGGDGDDEKIDEVVGTNKPLSLSSAVETLKSSAADLLGELKKSTRFTISAAAIKSSNAVITVARFLRIKK